MNESRITSRWSAFIVLTLACGSGSDPEATRVVAGGGREASRALDDSLAALVEGYKAGRLTRATAANKVADLIEPLTGFATQATDSMTLDLFEAAGAIVRERVDNSGAHGLESPGGPQPTQSR